MTTESSQTLCGLWIDDAGKVHVSVATPDGGREERREIFRPFAWLGSESTYEGVQLERLRGEGAFGWLAHAETLDVFEAFFKSVREGAPVDILKPYESQWLLQKRARLYADMHFHDLRRCQLDIETGAAEPGTFSDARNAGDRVLAIGLQCGARRELLTLGEESDAGEKRLLLAFNDRLRELDPDVIEGHNIFKFDFDYLRQRSRRHKVPCAWGRFGLPAEFRNSRLKVAERWIDFSRCDLPGRAVIDTYLLVQLYDITAREMTAYGLKDVAVYFGLTPESGEGRTYIEGAQIQHVFRQNREDQRALPGSNTEGGDGRLEPASSHDAQPGPLQLGIQELCRHFSLALGDFEGQGLLEGKAARLQCHAFGEWNQTQVLGCAGPALRSCGNCGHQQGAGHESR